MLDRILPWRETCEHTESEWVVEETFESIHHQVDIGLVAAVVSEERERCVDCGNCITVTCPSGYTQPNKRYHEHCKWSLNEGLLIGGDIDDLPPQYNVPQNWGAPSHSSEPRL